MMKKPVVTVVMPAYNCAKYISESIESILMQSFLDFELIIINDGSTDNTDEVINYYLSNHKIKYKKIKHSGKPSIARNTAIKMAAGKYITFCDADDILPREALKRKMEFLHNFQEVEFVFTDFVCFRLNHQGKDFDKLTYFQKNSDYLKNLQPEYIKKQIGNYYLFNTIIRKLLLTKLFIHTSTVLITKRALENVGLFNEELLYGEDWDLWLRVLSKFQAGAVDETLCYFRHSEGSLTKDQKKYFSSIIRQQEGFLNTEKLTQKEIIPIKRNISEKAFYIGYKEFEEGHTGNARKWFWKSIKNDIGWKEMKYYFLTFLGDYLLSILRKIKWKIKSI